MAAKSPWMICPHCDGDGHHSRRLGEINREEWDEEDFERYLEGAYDAQCEVCRGAGKVREDEFDDRPLIVRDGVVYRDADDASEHWLRMAGG